MAWMESMEWMGRRQKGVSVELGLRIEIAQAISVGLLLHTRVVEVMQLHQNEERAEGED